MAILQNRMSTIAVPDTYFPPDDVFYGPLISHEAGPIALNDPSEGQKYQDWILTYSDPDFTLTPQTTGSPSIVGEPVAEVIRIGLAFDQNGHQTICYNTLTNGYLYWWDSSVPGFVTTDFGVNVFSLALSLDDKRDRQTQANDIILWYTKVGATNYDLFNRIQRERFEEETLMANDIPKYIAQVGMHIGYRGQVTLARRRAIPVLPPGPPAQQANLDFELGDMYWEKTNDFTIAQSDPYAGNWSAILDTDSIGYSILENGVYTSIIPEDPVFVNAVGKGTEATSIILGFRFYNAAKSLVAAYTDAKNITTDWVQVMYSVYSPSNAVYVRIFVESDATDGIVSLDNFSFANLLDIGQFYEVELDIPVYYDIELDTKTIFEVE